MKPTFRAGAAAVDISPTDSQFLQGYPHVERFSTGIHDPLMSSALYLDDGRTPVMFIANDILFVGRRNCEQVRARIAERVPIPAGNIMVTSTHTHSGPVTVDYLSTEADKIVPKADPAYVERMCNGIVEAGVRACENAKPAVAGIAVADATGIGTNRRDPAGPADMSVPVLAVRAENGGPFVGCMLVCSMHPTVMHEDSSLVSADFPGMARQYLQAETGLGANCPVLHHTGPAGNQSPRHVTKENTFEEATRIGNVLGAAVADALQAVGYSDALQLSCERSFLELPTKTFPSVKDAQARLTQAVQRLQHLGQSGAPRQEVRTAECDWFGAEEMVTLAHAAEDGRLEQAVRSCMPAEVQIVGVGPWRFVGWPGEIFVEYALEVKRQAAQTSVISLANGEFQGYIVTPEAAAEGGYEASNGLFSCESGPLLVDRTIEMLANGGQG